jgi:hypothetical protein
MYAIVHDIDKSITTLILVMMNTSLDSTIHQMFISLSKWLTKVKVAKCCSVWKADKQIGRTESWVKSLFFSLIIASVLWLTYVKDHKDLPNNWTILYLSTLPKMLLLISFL